jgi:predicted enzyme related to lactoylglutathione lyase
MTSGVKTIIYPVKDLARAKTLFSGLLGVEPSVDARYYVQFDVAGQQIGLDPNGHTHGMTPYWTVDDVNATLQELVEAGAETVEAVRDVGGGKLIAAVKDPDGNVIGITQDPAG